MAEQEHDAAITQIIDEARAFVTERPTPDLSGAVMRQITATRLPRRRVAGFRGILQLLWAPRDIRFHWRPAYLLIAAALLPLIVFLPHASAPANTGPQMFVQFHLDAPDATDVRLAGSFTNWEPRYELHQVVPGAWTITLPLSAGVHDYVFVVNGQRWIPDPYAARVDDGFGGVNSRIALVAPDAPRL